MTDDRETTLAMVRVHLRLLFDIDPAKVDAETPMVDLELDSLDVVELTMALEEEFVIRVDDREAEDVQTVGQLVALVDRKRGGQERVS